MNVFLRLHVSQHHLAFLMHIVFFKVIFLNIIVQCFGDIEKKVLVSCGVSRRAVTSGVADQVQGCHTQHKRGALCT